MTTSPQQISRIQTLAGDDLYRKEVLMLLTISNERIERLMEGQEHAKQWMIEHDLKDTERFTRGDERMARIEANAAPVRSSVNDYEQVKEQVKGAKRLILGVVAIITVIGGGILGLFEIIERWKQ